VSKLVGGACLGTLMLASGAWLGAGAHHPAAILPPAYLDAESARLYGAKPMTLVERRTAEIAFWEQKGQEDRQSADAMAAAASLYLQRARETADFADVKHAEAAAREAIARRPVGAGASRTILVNTLLAQHRFPEALAEATRVSAEQPGIPEYLALRAECEMENGAYDRARASFDTLRRGPLPLSAMGRLARWDELRGDFTNARRLLETAAADVRSRTDLSTEQAAWFQLRLGDLAFRSGKVRRARSEWEAGLLLRPADHRLHAALARLDAAEGRWRDAIAHGDAVLAVQLDPVTLGVMADAQRALGDTAAATRSEAALAASVSGEAGIVHRAWMLRQLDDRRNADAIVSMARADVATRPDVAGWDLLAWALDAAGDARAADSAMTQALRLGTRDAAFWYHAGVIAHHVRDDARAARMLDSALTLNERFDHRHAAAARALRDSLAAPHALHTSLSKVMVEGDTVLMARLRLFTDDFTTALGARFKGVKPDTLAYATARFTVKADNGAPVAWRSCGATVEQDLTVVCLRARVARAPARLAVVNGLLTEAFADQVNIVQVTMAGHTKSLLFTRDAQGEQAAP
jgi:tetratricopeptide (TPR) repeat protein